MVIHLATLAKNEVYDVSQEVRIRQRKGKAVIATNGWGEEKIFPSAREAGRQLNISKSSIAYAASGKRKTAGGYRFRYAE